MSPNPAKSNVLLCLATQKGLEVLRVAKNHLHAFNLWVCTFEESSVAESYHSKIRELAEEIGCNRLSIREYRSRLHDFVHENSIASILCVGWKFLVPQLVVEQLAGEVIVAHDSLLPKLRGFAPLATAMIAGDSETGVSFLRVGDAVDNGKIVWQARTLIEPRANISAVIDKVASLYAAGAQSFFEGSFGIGDAQNEHEATYSIWRDDDDYQIDWTLDAETIERMTRALGHPYLGARTTLHGQRVVLQKVTVQDDLQFAIRQPGKVWSLDELGRPLVVCGRGMLRIDEATQDHESIIPLMHLRVRFK